MTKRDDGTWHCQLCDYSSKYTTRVQDHIEAQHFQSDGYQYVKNTVLQKMHLNVTFTDVIIKFNNNYNH